MKAILRTAAAGLAIASFGVASAASAATSDDAQVTATILTALSVDVDPLDNTLNFGTIADGGITGDQTITVSTAGARVGACPTGLICGGTVNAPTFNITGLAGTNVQVSFENASETLSITGYTGTLDSTMAVNAFTTSLTGNQVLLFDGSESFTVGGTLTVSPGQAPGVYTGTTTVQVAYF